MKSKVLIFLSLGLCCISLTACGCFGDGGCWAGNCVLSYDTGCFDPAATTGNVMSDGM
ncbi:MAG: hypothetical protein ACYCQI_14425 [Gammaproteobacteria bacterium]